MALGSSILSLSNNEKKKLFKNLGIRVQESFLYTWSHFSTRHNIFVRNIVLCQLLTLPYFVCYYAVLCSHDEPIVMFSVHSFPHSNNSQDTTLIGGCTKCNIFLNRVRIGIGQINQVRLQVNHRKPIPKLSSQKLDL